jgi:hypothetical protein
METARKRIEVMPPTEVMSPAEVIPPAEGMRPRVKPRFPQWALITASAGVVAVVIVVFVMLRPRPKNAHGTIPVTEVQAMSGNVTKGNALVVGVALNEAPNVTLTSSGSGCKSTKWDPKAEANYSRFLSENTFVGVASGSGPCEVTATVPSPTAIGIQLGEFSGVGDSAIDAYGTLAASGNTNVNVSAGNVVTAPGDLALVLWCSQHINSSSAAGWAATFNQKYMGAFTQYRIASGITANFTSANFPDAGVATGVMLVLRD